MTPEKIQDWKRGLIVNRWANCDVVIRLDSGLTMTAGELRWLLDTALEHRKSKASALAVVGAISTGGAQ